MNPIDLESARARWQAESRRLGDRMVVNTDQLSRLLAQRTATNLGRRRRSLVIKALLSGLCLVALVWFAIVVADRPYQVIAGVFGMFISTSLWQAMVERRALNQLPAKLPPVAALELVMALRHREQALTRAILASSVLLWWPFVLIVARVLGADLMRWIEPTVTLVHVGLGLILLLPIWWFLRWFEGRNAQGDELDRSGSGGDALLEIAWQFRTMVQVADSPPASLQPVPETTLMIAKRVQRRLQWGCALCGAMVLLNGGHLVMSGGEWLVLTTGIVFQLSVVAWMVSTILAADQWRHLRQAEPVLAVWERRVPLMLRRRDEVLSLLVQVAPVSLASGLGSWLGAGLIEIALLLGAGFGLAWLLGPSTTDRKVLTLIRARAIRLLSFGTVPDAALPENRSAT